MHGVDNGSQRLHAHVLGSQGLRGFHTRALVNDFSDRSRQAPCPARVFICVWTTLYVPRLSTIHLCCLWVRGANWPTCRYGPNNLKILFHGLDRLLGHRSRIHFVTGNAEGTVPNNHARCACPFTVLPVHCCHTWTRLWCCPLFGTLSGRYRRTSPALCQGQHPSDSLNPSRCGWPRSHSSGMHVENRHLACTTVPHAVLTAGCRCGCGRPEQGLDPELPRAHTGRVHG